MPEYIIGIDLGTANSAVGYWDEDKVRIHNIGMRAGEALLPSAVAYDKYGNWLVGEQAMDQWEANPDGTVISVKRKMLWPEKVIKTLGGQEMTPVDISAKILETIRKKVELIVRGETKITAAVISVPYRFRGHEIEATIKAGELAGLPVINTIHEPTAAALAYAKEQSFDLHPNDILFIFDLGGGTFDITIFKINEVSDSKTVFEVVGTGGERELGGDDFDERVIEHILQWYKNKCNIDIRDITTYPSYTEDSEQQEELEMTRKLLMVPIRKLARASKERLAAANSTSVILNTGLGEHINFELDRKTFAQQLISDLKQKIVDSVNKSLEEAKLKSDDLSRIVLVGGSSKLFFIAGYKDEHGEEVPGLIEEIFGKKPYIDREVSTTVARGATYKVAIDQGQTNGDIELIETLPFDIGIGLENEEGAEADEFYVMLKKGERYGTSRTEQFGFETEDVDQFNLLIYEGKGEILPQESEEYGAEIQRMTNESHYRRGRIIVSGFNALGVGEASLNITLATDPKNKSIHVRIMEDHTPGWTFEQKLEYTKTFESSLGE